MIALNLNTKRVCIRTKNIQAAYSWLVDFFDAPNMLDFSFPFRLRSGGQDDFEIIPSSDWTVEYNPEPPLKRPFLAPPEA